MIPITFNKDDENNVKKGNVRAQDLASFLSISMPNTAGVLSIWGDDCGYVSIVPTTGYATITMKKGYVNIYGRCIYVEQGEQVQFPLPSSGTETGYFGIRINLGETGGNEVTWFKKATGDALKRDNLLSNEINGIHEFPMFSYSASSSSLTLTKVFTAIENIKDYLNGANFITQFTSDNSRKMATTEFVQNVVNTVRTTYNQIPDSNGGTGFGSKGCLKLDNGIIIKWGKFSTPGGRANQPIQVVYDDTYPFSQVFNVVVSGINGNDSNSGYIIRLWDCLNTTYFRYIVNTDRIDCQYFAIGI